LTRLEEDLMTRTWLITGSARGLGRELAAAALEAGDAVVATARRPERVADLADRFDDRVRVVQHDVTDPAAAARAVDTAVEAFGRLDVVVNNAGYADSASIEEMTEESFRAQLETDLMGVFHVTRAALPVLRRQRSGHFLQISSIGGRVGGSPGLGAYQAAKFAVEGFSEVLRREVEPLGIRVTIVEPGALRTDWAGSSMRLAAVGPDYQPTVGRMHERRRATDGHRSGDPARAARALVDVVGLEHPPLRLLLGSDALRLADRSARARAAEAEVWADVSRSVDATGAGVRGLADVLHLAVPAAS
jgi:NAD(P)-dependent dehydrogenase (short-subunit alcohol dehydrogenase family)